jgi:preprotein translocase subunit SecD
MRILGKILPGQGQVPFGALAKAGLIIASIALAAWLNLPRHPSLKIGSVFRDMNIKLGLDLQGGTQLIYRAIMSGISDEDATDALGGVRDVIERRVNAFGIAEPVIQTNRTGGEHRVIIELAGVHDPEEAIALIGETPQLDFRREVDSAEAAQQFNIDNPAAITGPIFERTDLTGKDLKRATVSFDPVSGTPEVNLEFNSEGTQLFADLTKQSLNKRIAIYLDGVPISAPVVQSEITNGQAVISGGFQLADARQLAQRLNAGALPIPIELIGQQTIGPSLGRLSIAQSIEAGVFGLMAVVLWMIFFYRLPGLVAGAALIVYALFFLVIVRALPITLTLAGIAGLILSIGMAVDANVLIFERFRENIRRGRSVRFAIEEGFVEAWSSIKASNVSSLITALILYYFGTSIVRGFALTYALGTMLSMITAVTITRTVLFWLFAAAWTHRPFLLGVKASATPK